MSLTFSLPLRTSIVPAYAAGSATPTFTRASTATVVDHEGVLRYCRSGEARFWGARRVANVLMTDPNNSNWSSWATLNVSITTGIADPSGGTDACRVTATGAGAAFKALGGNGILNTTRFCCSSIWIRRVVGVGAIQLEGPDDTGIDITGAVTTDWKRFSATGMAPGGNAYVGINTLATSGDEIDVWHPQIEDISGASNQAPGEWVGFSTWGPGSSPYHGANVDGVRYFDTENGNSVASNVVTEAAGAPIADSVLLGYLAEGAFTNRLLYSEDFTNAAWVKTNVTVTANSAAAPDGATTADTLTASAANGTVIQDLGVVASAQKNGSLWLKRKTGSGNIQLTLDNGTGWTTVAVTGSWTRFLIEQTLANEDFGIRIATSGDEVYAWGGEVATASIGGAIPSYSPTTSAASTKAADLLGYPSAGNAPTSQGTIAAQLRSASANGGECAIAFSAGGYGAPGGLLFRKNAANQISIGGSSSDEATTFISGTFAPLPRKVTGQWSGVSMWVYAEANKSLVDNTLDYTGVGTTNINIGTLAPGGSQEFIGTIRDICIWDRVMEVDENGDVIEGSPYPRLRRRRGR